MPIYDTQRENSNRMISGVMGSTKLRGRFKFASPIEGLEKRLMWSISTDANGWTIVGPSVDTRNIYVSSSTGNDSNPGTISAPIKGFAKAEGMLTNGEPDHILLKSGDTFNDAFIQWVYSGRSTQEPMLVSYYGTGALPIVDSGTNPAGFATPINQAGNVTSINYVDVIGIQFQANLRNPSVANFNTSSAGGGTGFYFENPGGNILLEDDSFEYYRYNMDIEGVKGALGGITIRRCVDEYAYGASYSHSQGIYAYNVSNISIVQSVFDHDGWSSVVPTAEDLGFNHDMYIASTCDHVDIEQNIIANAAYAGIMARAGGIINNNLFINDAISVAYGQANGANSDIGGVTGTLIGNITVGDKTYDYGQAAGQGFDIGNVEPGAGLVVSSNIFTQDNQNAKPAIELDPATGTYNPTQAVGLNNVTIENNIVNGWRQSIDLDGRFVAGGTGLYAFNALTVKNNDFINATTEEVRHANAFSTAQESWSGDRYYDAVLSQSSWITVQSLGVPYSTWASSYDIGAQQLSSLPYPNPYVSIATYDSTLGGPGTFGDFLANADQLSINNYQLQYQALAAINYIQGGFGVAQTTSTGTIGSNGASGPPTASATALNLNTSVIGTTSYSFTVNYTDANSLALSSLSGGNLLVTGPNGFFQFATYLSSTPSTTDNSGYQHVSATYAITSPIGGWVKGDDGTYTISMLANQVHDAYSSFVPDGVIGTFSADFTPPTAVATAANISAAQGASNYNFTVTYSDLSGIDTSSLDNYSVQVSGPGTFAKYAAVSNIASTGTTAVVTYTVPATGSTWATGTYTITLASGSVNDLAGNSVPGGVLGSFISQSTTNLNGSISGTVFNDANGNGGLDPQENKLTGITVFIDLAGTGVIAAGDPTTTTDSNGNYTFTYLPAGQYTLIEQVPFGFIATAPSGGSAVVTLTAGQTATAVNFANQLKLTIINGLNAGPGVYFPIGGTLGGVFGGGIATSSGVNTNNQNSTATRAPLKLISGNPSSKLPGTSVPLQKSPFAKGQNT